MIPLEYQFNFISGYCFPSVYQFDRVDEDVNSDAVANPMRSRLLENNLAGTVHCSYSIIIVR